MKWRRFIAKVLKTVSKKGIAKGIEQGIEQGELKKARETALSLVEMGLPVEKIAKAVRLSVEEVQKWIDEGVVEQ